MLEKFQTETLDLILISMLSHRTMRKCINEITTGFNLITIPLTHNIERELSNAG